jgi:anti-anti-sigma regulatory factor
MDQERAMDLSSYPNGEGHVVEVRGELTAREPLAKLPLAVQNVLDRGSTGLVKVNVGHVEIIDLEGVAALIRARETALRAGARFQLIDGQPRVRARLRIAGVLRLLEEGEL